MKIFIVDDDPEYQQIIKETFYGYNVEMEFANDAASAVKRLGEKDAKFDQVICDGLFGKWETVHKATQEHGLPMLLYTTNPDILGIAAEKGIPTLNKSTSSLKELRNTIFPPSASIEARL